MPLPLLCERLRGLLVTPPVGDRRREHVVVDLDAAAVGRPEDALGDERAHERGGRGQRQPAVGREIVDPVGDLRPGRRDEVREQHGDPAALGGIQPGERALDVLLDDQRRAAELPQRLPPQHDRPRRALRLPEPLEHELEIRRFDALDERGRRDPAQAAGLRLDPARRDLVEHRLDQLGLGRHRVVRRGRIPTRDRAEDREAPGVAIEPLEPEVVRENAGNGRAERVELPERVLADPEQDVDAEPTLGHEPGELPGERARAALALVVEEVLLGLVEDEQEVVSELVRPLAQPGGERAAGILDVAPERRLDGVACRGGDRRDGIAGPRRHENGGLAVVPELPDHARAQQRALADPARAEEHGQPAGPEVRARDGDLAVAPEEQAGVRARVVVGGEALPRRPRADGYGRRDGAHATASTGAVSTTRPASRSRYVSSVASKRSIPRWRQKSRSPPRGCGCTAHER